MEAKLKTISVSLETYEFIKTKAKEDDRSVRSWLDKYFDDTFPDELTDAYHDILKRELINSLTPVATSLNNNNNNNNNH